MSSYNPYFGPNATKQPDLKDFGNKDIYIKDTNDFYTEQFKSYLKDLQNYAYGALTTFDNNIIPIKIDLNSRTIDMAGYYRELGQDEKNGFLSLAEDHRAEVIYFETDRYFEGVDLMKCSCIVEYINAGDEPRIYPVTLRSLRKELDETGYQTVERMLFAWNIGNEATLYDGTIQFAVTFFQIAYDIDEVTKMPINHTICYALHTKPAFGKIESGLKYKDEEEQKMERDEYYTIQNTHYVTLVDMINQKNVYWNDL